MEGSRSHHGRNTHVLPGMTEKQAARARMLDALELPVLDLQQWAPRQVLARLSALRPGARSAHSASGADPLYPGTRP